MVEKIFNVYLTYNLDRFSGLKYLIFAPIFNQEIKGAISDSVTHLTFGSRFNQEIKNAIPNFVTQFLAMVLIKK